MSTILPNELNVNEIKFSEIKALDSGAKIMYMNYGENNSTMYIQVPEMELLWDPIYFAEADDSGKYTCKLSFKGHSSNDQVDGFLNKMKELDKYLMDCAVDNSKKWFGGKSLNKETIENLYNPGVKYAYDSNTGEINNNFAPTFSFKIVKRNGTHQCKLFDSNKDKINIDQIDEDNYTEVTSLLNKSSRLQVLLRCNGLWFAGGKFGSTWKAEQIKVNHIESMNDYAFRDDDEDGEEVIIMDD